MRSGTSFFNSTLYRKAFFRFWPIWALYGTLWLFLLPMPFLTAALRSQEMDGENLARYLARIAGDVPEMLSFGVIVAAAAGLACAMAVFSYLYSARSACTIHALPVRRESLFISHYLAGLSFLLLPHLAVYILTAAVEASLNCLALYELTVWLLAQSGACLFFYSFAAFCAMFTGNLVALPIFYGILNLLAYVLCSLINILLSRYFYGFASYIQPLLVDYLTPAYILERACSWVTGPDGGYGLDRPDLVGIYAAVGLLLALAALLVYRTRHIETAGDVVTVKVVRPVFKYGLAFCTGLTGGVWTTEILNLASGPSLTLWVIFWGVAGYFAGEMLLQKSFRVLRAWKGSVALGGVLLLLCLSVQLDWYGYETRLPAADQVESVTVIGLGSAPYDSGSNGAELTDPESIALVLQLHQAAIQLEDQQYDGRGADSYCYLYLDYTLSDGSRMRREYSGLPIRAGELETEGSFTALAGRLLSDRTYVERMYDFEEVEKGRLVEAWLDRVWNTQTQSYETVYVDGATQALWEAVKQDFAEGTIGVRYLLDYSQARLDNTCTTDLYFTVEYPGEDGGTEAAMSSSWSITLTPNASHTLSLLWELGVLDGTHIAPTYRAYVEDTEITGDEYRDFDGSISTQLVYGESGALTVP